MKSDAEINKMLIQLESIQMDKNAKYGWEAALRWFLINEKESDKHEK